VTEQLVTVDGVRLCVDTVGDPTSPAVLLISGATASMDWWEPEFCARLAGADRFVVRYDHRDTGRSQTWPAGAPGYTGEDLATDPLRVLDALDVDRAHLVGISMGGGIAQELAVRHPDRVATITLIATSPAGERADRTDLPPPEPEVAATFTDPAPAPDWTDRAAAVEYLVEGERPFAGPRAFDAERMRRIAGEVVDRTSDLAAATTNHWMLTGDGVPFRMAEIAVPALVLHGSADPLFPFPHGEALAAEIPDATLVPLPGMGHQVPPPELWDTVVAAIVRHTGHH
jgi:pimeloyl-ACP methyl ester carboxylesterase